MLPDARYDLKSFATDEERNNVAAYAVFHGTRTGPGGPVPPTGRSTTPTTCTSCSSRATKSPT